jgi:ADP-ribosyl-[dinitrogen reductase] hydrolase
MRHRNDLMLLRIAQGDAYGMAAEYCSRHPEEPEAIELYEFKRYLPHPSYHKLPPGTYTDDTQMSIAVTNVLLCETACKRMGLSTALTHEGFIAAFFNAFKRDERDGYSRGFQKLLEAAKSHEELRLSLKADSTKNGAAMRSVPLGVIRSLEELKHVAGLQAATTHATFEGINSSIAVALMSHFALYDRRGFSSMPGWLTNQLPLCEKFREPWVGPVQSRCGHSPYDVGLNTAWAVHTLLTTQTTLLGIMKQVLDWGGDTDSVASIAWGIASCRMREDVPEFFERDLEAKTGSPYGPKYLRELGKQLMDDYDVRK